MSDRKNEVRLNRRKLFKIGALAAGALAVGGGGAFVSKRVEGIEHDDLPNAIDKKLFKPFDQKNAVLTRAAGGLDPKLEKLVKGFHHSPVQNVPGYTQLDRALGDGGWALSWEAAPGQEYGQPNSGILGWEQEKLADTKFQFESPEAAATAIKSAGKLYGGTLVGIARNDPRFNYSELFDVLKRKNVSWDDFPFKPKTVVVVACEMNYECMATAPAWTEGGTVSATYSQALKAAGSLAVFFRALGYQAVASVNDLGVNVGYGIMAGLGEGARNGSLIVPKMGPRIRLSKVYTDFEGATYDKPKSYGVLSFCRHCKKCAMSCPSKAISMDDEPGFHPTWSDDPKDWFKNQIGIEKFHNNSEKCFRFWCENDGDCGACIAACPYNKPDFWHHRLVDASNVMSPGAVHTIMREMDNVFGYGKVNDPQKVKKFWKVGPPKGLRFGTRS
jgi:epoxyqueuosine reductase